DVCGLVNPDDTANAMPLGQMILAGGMEKLTEFSGRRAVNPKVLNFAEGMAYGALGSRLKDASDVALSEARFATNVDKAFDDLQHWDRSAYAGLLRADGKGETEGFIPSYRVSAYNQSGWRDVDLAAISEQESTLVSAVQGAPKVMVG